MAFGVTIVVSNRHYKLSFGLFIFVWGSIVKLNESNKEIYYGGTA